MTDSLEDIKEDFSKWFRYMLHKTTCCFERDVLRDCMPVLKARYIDRAKAWPDDPKDTTLLSEASEFKVELDTDTRLVHFLDAEGGIRLSMYFDEWHELASKYQQKFVYPPTP